MLLTTQLHRTVLLNLFVGLALFQVTSAHAGGIGYCSSPVVFGGSLNIVLAQYQAADEFNFDSDDDDYEDEPSDSQRQEAEEKLRDAQHERFTTLARTAERLLWLSELDLFFSAGFGGFSVVGLRSSAMNSNTINWEECSSSRIVTNFESDQPSSGKALAVMTGRIYQEGNDVFFQSYLLPGRFFDRQLRRVDELDLSISRSDGGSLKFSAPVFNGEITFPPRKITTTDIATIYEDFERSALLYPRKGQGEPRRVPFLNPSGVKSQFLYSIGEIDPDGWMRIKIYGSKSSDWIKADPERSASLRDHFPELDFWRELLGTSSFVRPVPVCRLPLV